MTKSKTISLLMNSQYYEQGVSDAEQKRWIPCSERLPKQNEYIEYYLIQDEYGDMYVARYTSDGWISIDSILQDNVVAWMPLPKRYEYEGDNNDK